MDPFLIIAIIIGVAAIIGIVLFVIAMILKRKGTKTPENKEEEMAIAFKEISALDKEDEERLVEIKDKEIIKRINTSVPGALKAVANSNVTVAYGNISKSGQLFQAVVPGTNTLKAATNTASGSASLQAVNVGNLDMVAALGAANAVMGLASIVVGQYYMSQIDKKLKVINSHIEKITSFQESEFRSKVYALVAEAQKISTFQVETVENHELRTRELSHLRNLEHECVELLGQANLSLQEISGKQGLDFKGYEKATEDGELWYQYQQILLRVIKEISDLSYTLNLGAISRENSNALCVPYMKQSEDTLLKLKGWHESNVKRLGVNLEENKRKRQGVEGFFMKPLTLFNKNLNYKGMSEGTVQRIEHQTGTLTEEDDESDLFKEDVNIIAKDGKLYYLPKK